MANIFQGLADRLEVKRRRIGKIRDELNSLISDAESLEATLDDAETDLETGIAQLRSAARSLSELA